MSKSQPTSRPRQKSLAVAPKALLLFFYSPTSGPSRRMESLVSGLSVRERKRLRLRLVNADVRTDLLASFGLKDIPALVLIREHKVVACLEGRATGAQISEAILPQL